MGSAKDAVSALDFDSEGEMWFTECVLYICFILIWYLLCKISWHFCIKPGSPKFTQFNQKALKPIKRAAEESRMRRQSEYEQTQTATHISNGSTINSTMTSTNEPQNVRAPTVSSTATTATSTLKSSSRRSHDRSKSMSLANDETPEEFQLQICKIHRNLRVCFVTSLCCTAIAITSISYVIHYHISYHYIPSKSTQNRIKMIILQFVNVVTTPFYCNINHQPYHLQNIKII